MKKIFSLVAIFILMLSFTGCGDDKKANTNQPTTQKVEQKVLSAAEEKVVYQNFKNQIQKGLVAVDNDWDTLWSPTITNFANGLIDYKLFDNLNKI